MLRSFLACFYHLLLELIWPCLFRGWSLFLVWLVGYGVVWKIYAVLFEWGRSHQRYLQTFGLWVQEVPVAVLDSQSSPSGKNFIIGVINFGWTLSGRDLISGGGTPNGKIPAAELDSQSSPMGKIPSTEPRTLVGLWVGESHQWRGTLSEKNPTMKDFDGLKSSWEGACRLMLALLFLSVENPISGTWELWLDSGKIPIVEEGLQVSKISQWKVSIACKIIERKRIG